VWASTLAAAVVVRCLCARREVVTPPIMQLGGGRGDGGCEEVVVRAESLFNKIRASRSRLRRRRSSRRSCTRCATRLGRAYLLLVL
jgi:hypothetical protein